ncbi:hypothetical protein D3C72_1856560 [compost metagenome]
MDNGNQQVILLDLKTEAVAATIDIKMGLNPKLALSEDGTKVFFSRTDNYKDGTGQTLDLATRQISPSFPLPPTVYSPNSGSIPLHPNHIVINELVNTAANHTSIIDVNTGQIVFDFDGAYLGNRESSSRVAHIDFAPDGTLLIVSTKRPYDQSEGLYRLDVWKKIEDKK